MADAQPNFGGPAVDPPGMAKKKKAKAPRKPQAECTPEEITKLDMESVKRRNRRAIVKDNAPCATAVGLASTGSSVARSPHCVSPTSRTTPMSPGFPPPRHDAHTRFSGSPDVSVVAPSTPRPSAFIDLNVTPGSSSSDRPCVVMQGKQARPPFAGTMPSPRVLFDEMPTPTASVDDPYCTQFMEDVIYDGGHVPTYDPEETQSQDGRAQFVADEEADDRADYDHGDSWHEDDDIYCEGDGDGDEDEGNGVDISCEPLFIDELTQRAEAQKRKKSILTGSYTQDEDKLICNCWMEVSQDPRTGAQQKGLVFWTRVHKTFHERKMFEPYQITSNRGITSIQKRWLFIQQECNKYCAALESVEAWPVSGLSIGDMAFQSLEAFKARHNDKPFTLTHCWTIINNCPKFKDQYRQLQRKRGKKTTKFAGSGDDEALKRPRGKTNFKDMRDEKKWQSKDEEMKQYLELQRKKLEMEEAAKKRKVDLQEAARQRQLDIEAANVEARKRQLDIEATNVATKAKEVALAIMNVDLTKMSEKTRSWFEAG
ncbi:putative DBINO protein [Hordeum vulgare]|nr:putative DBINO protein [Hordeum vulgare]